VKQALTGGLLFTHEQSKDIQAEVEKRTSVQNASLDERHMKGVRKPAEPERIPQHD